MLRGFLRQVFLGLLAGIAIGGLAVGLLLTMVLPSGRTTPKPPASVATAAGQPGPVYTIRDRIVNLADAGGRRYLRVSLAIEFQAKEPVPRDEAAQKAYYKKFDGDIRACCAHRIEDAVTMLLSSKSYADIATPEGKERLKQELKDRINEALHGEEVVTNVYITDFVVQ